MSKRTVRRRMTTNKSVALILVILTFYFRVDTTLGSSSSDPVDCSDYSGKRSCNKRRPLCNWERPFKGSARHCMEQSAPNCTDLSNDSNKCMLWPSCTWDEESESCTSVSQAPTSSPSADSRFAPSSNFSALEKSVKNPNILFVMVDDWRDVKIDGLTPNVDAFRANATEFTNAYSQYPQCGPSRTSILGGRYPHKSGEVFADMHSPDFRTLPFIHPYLRSRGYRTAIAGKVFHTKASFYPSEWFNETDITANPDLNVGWPFNVCKSRFQMCTCIEQSTYSSDACRDYLTLGVAQDWIHAWQNETQPWFMSVGFIRPHSDYRVPEWIVEENISYDWNRILKKKVPPIAKTTWSDTAMKSARNTRTAINSYLSAVHYADHMVGQLLDTLHDTNQFEDTAIILASDHGLHLSDDFDHFGKWTLEDASLHVPLLVKPPKNRYANYIPGSQRSQVVELVDIFPTIADFASLSLDSLDLDGRSLTPLLNFTYDETRSGRAISVMTICDGNKNKARYKPCTTLQRGSTNVWGVAYTVRTNETRHTEYRKLITKGSKCISKTSQASCTNTQGCVWEWLYTFADGSLNTDFYCVADVGSKLNIDWTSDGLLGVEYYENGENSNVNIGSSFTEPLYDEISSELH